MGFRVPQVILYIYINISKGDFERIMEFANGLLRDTHKEGCTIYLDSHFRGHPKGGHEPLFRQFNGV